MITLEQVAGTRQSLQYEKDIRTRLEHPSTRHRSWRQPNTFRINLAHAFRTLASWLEPASPQGSTSPTRPEAHETPKLTREGRMG